MPKNRKIFLAILSAVVLAGIIGVVIGVISNGDASKSSLSVSDLALQSVGDSTAAVTNELWTRTIAVVDLTRLMEAHPWTRFYKKQIDEQRAGTAGESDLRIKSPMTSKVDTLSKEQRKAVVQDIQRIISAYAREHHFTLVLDRSATPSSDRPGLYSSDGTDFKMIASTEGIKDITNEILQEIARQQAGVARFLDQ